MYIGPFLAFIATSAMGLLSREVTFFVDDGLTYGELFIIVYAFVLFIGIITDKLQDTIEIKNSLINRYEEESKNKTAGLLDHYKRLNRFQLNEVLHDVMKAF